MTLQTQSVFHIYDTRMQGDTGIGQGLILSYHKRVWLEMNVPYADDELMSHVLLHARSNVSCVTSYSNCFIWKRETTNRKIH
jgi:hypothetical protein